MIMIEPLERSVNLGVPEMKGSIKHCDSCCQSLANAKMVGLPRNLLVWSNKARCDARNCDLPRLLGRASMKIYVS